MKRSARPGSAKMAMIIALLLCTTVVVAYYWFQGLKKTENKSQLALTSNVIQGEFLMSVTESGDVESSSNVEIRCRVKSQGRAGTVVLRVIPEGTKVKEGDFLCQLDDSLFRDQLVEQRIQVAKDLASRIQSESDLATAQQVLEEFRNGVYEQERAALGAEIALANETVRRARDMRGYSQLLNRKGFVTKTQLEADEFAVEKAELELSLAQQKLEVYERFTQPRTIAEYEAEIQKQTANLEAAQFTYELSTNRIKEIEEQIARCRLTAPSEGTLVYANEVDRRGDASFVIEEGATLRDGQPIFYLPDPTRMQVRAAVNDSKINLVNEGQPVTIRLDSQPEIPIQGEVTRVAPYPLPRRWFQAPIEYEVVVTIMEQSELVRSGLRAKVEILVGEIPDAIQAPVAAVLENESANFVLVKTVKGLEARPVKIGSNNSSHVVILEGLASGEEVLIDPENYREQVVFPTVVANPQP